MRTTLTLEPDVSAKLRAEARRTGRPFKEIVNETLRRGLAERRPLVPREPFRVQVRDLGELEPGLSLDNVGLWSRMPCSPPWRSSTVPFCARRIATSPDSRV